eukprot:Skav216969  [mRNA]  locus=scaffold2531:231564:231830:- [translate_table: standard]
MSAALRITFSTVGPYGQTLQVAQLVSNRRVVTSKSTIAPGHNYFTIQNGGIGASCDRKVLYIPWESIWQCCGDANIFVIAPNNIRSIS